MSAAISGIRGMNDILPPDTEHWQTVEQCLRATVQSYGYRELRIPVVERTELFSRSIGEVTDIVAKEMYSFADRNDENLTLRPEATAGVVRAAIAHGLLHNQKQKFWCAGPMFRYEKPQKGRYRQFHQFGLESFGYSGPDIDAELILIAARIWQLLGIRSVSLQLNSLGTPESRQRYRAALVEYFSAVRGQLDAESLERLERNPMRLLDSKDPSLQPLIAEAPQITAYLDSESAEHFAGLQQLLQSAGLEFTVNPRLVRGLDYYTRTVFEWVTDRLGSQAAVCSGGRYDGLVEHLGGNPTPAVGWAIGLERLVELSQLEAGSKSTAVIDVAVIAVGNAAVHQAMVLTEQWRWHLPQLRIENACGGGSFKAQFRRADKSGAQLAVILGDAEMEAGRVGLKPLRDARVQQDVPWGEAPAAIARLMQESVQETA